MFRVNENKKRFGMIVIAVCLTVVGPARADWQQQDKLLASDGDANDYFALDLSISGDYAIVGAGGDDNFTGSAYIFKRDGTSWTEQVKLTASDGEAGNSFGSSVSINGDYAIVGAACDNDKGDHSGSAYIFKRSDDPNDPNWYEQTKLLASDGEEYDGFGVSVSINGYFAIVGAHGDDSYTGSAYIFARIGRRWLQLPKLTASDGVIGDKFGCFISISGDYAIVGAPDDDDKGTDSGSAYIFYFDGTNWTQQDKLLPSDGAAGDWFGWSVFISGNYAIVGAWWDDDNGEKSGSAYIFKRDAASWVQQAKLTASDGAAGDGFGCSVFISGDYVIAGALCDSDKGFRSGSAYIFERVGETWTEQAKLLAADGAAEDRFGISVSISGDYVIVGANGDDNFTGSAYMFKLVLCPTADLSGDCFVDFVDFAIFTGQWLQGN